VPLHLPLHLLLHLLFLRSTYHSAALNPAFYARQMQRACNKLFSTRVILCGPISDQSLFITRTHFLYILAAIATLGPVYRYHSGWLLPSYPRHSDLFCTPFQGQCLVVVSHLFGPGFPRSGFLDFSANM
jgi:hypothetical protein